MGFRAIFDSEDREKDISRGVGDLWLLEHTAEHACSPPPLWGRGSRTCMVPFVISEQQRFP